jgi:hypothetical protein
VRPAQCSFRPSSSRWRKPLFNAEVKNACMAWIRSSRPLSYFRLHVAGQTDRTFSWWHVVTVMGAVTVPVTDLAPCSTQTVLLLQVLCHY